MDKVGISFRSPITPDEVLEKYVKPLRTALQKSSAGIYANYLRQVDLDAIEPTEHLLVFEVHGLEAGEVLLVPRASGQDRRPLTATVRDGSMAWSQSQTRQKST